MTKTRAEVAFGATWGLGTRVGGGASGASGLGVEGYLRVQSGGAEEVAKADECQRGWNKSRPCS